jgi:UBA/TS-N domain
MGGDGGANPFATGANPLAALGGALGAMEPGGGQQPSREQQEAAIAMLESNPALQQMLSTSIRQNPGMIRQFMQMANPAAAGMMNNMSDDQLSSMMEMVTNPAAMRGIMRLQEQMQNNPNNGMMMPNPMEMMALMSGGANSPFGGATAGANPLAAGSPWMMGNAPSLAQPNPWASSSSSQQRPAQPMQPPVVRYARQLEQIRNMGFDDEVAALSALERANGNLNRAVDFLLESSSNGAGEHSSSDS